MAAHAESTFLMAGFYTSGIGAGTGAHAHFLADGGAPYGEADVPDPEVQFAAVMAASESAGSDTFSKIGVYSSSPERDGEGGDRGKISKSDKLRVFLTSDYPLGLDEGEIASDSAERIRQLAFELHNLGHQVVVMAPGYLVTPEITNRAPFPIRHVLFTPSDGRLSDFGRASFGFDVPMLNNNPYLNSDFLLKDMTEEHVDRLVMGYLAMMRFTSLIFGDPNVVITSHATSLWNYAASRYPRFSMVSASDVINEGMHPKLKKLIRLGASSVHMFLALSDLESRRLSAIVPKAELVKKLPFDVSLFGARSDTGKRELLARYSDSLKGLSEDHRWVMLHDRSGHPDVLKYLVKVSHELERGNSDVAAIIVSSHGDPKHVTREIEDRMLERVRLVQPTKRGEVELLLSNGDATIIFNESGELSKSDHPMGRELWIASRLAVILNGNDEGLSTMYFPGRIVREEAGVRGYFGRYIVDALADFEKRSRDLNPEVREGVLAELRRMKKNASWTTFLLDELGYSTRARAKKNAQSDEDDPHVDTFRSRAIRQLRYTVRKSITADIAEIAYTGIVPDEIVIEQTGVDSSTIEREIRRQRRWSIMTYLEDFLYRAANESVLGPGGLEYRAGYHRPLRAERLDAIKFNSEVREAFDDLIHELEAGRPIGDPFRRWQRKALSAIYRSSFKYPADEGALPNPRTNQNAVLSEVARLSGISTKGLQDYLKTVLDGTEPEDRIEKYLVKGPVKAPHPCDCGKYPPPSTPEGEDGDDDNPTEPTEPTNGKGGNLVSLLQRRLANGED